MPSTSAAQGRFMGMVHALQTGQMPVSKASPRVRHVATTMKPKDVTEFASTKTKGLPEHVDDKPEKKSSAFLSAAMLLIKQADLTDLAQRMQQSVQKVHVARRKQLESENKRLKAHGQTLFDALQKTRTDAMANQQVPMPPQPPAAQPPYGSMLTAQLQQQQGGARGAQGVQKR